MPKSRNDAFRQYVTDNEHTLATALRVYAEHMEKAAGDAHAEYERGQADAGARAAQDASLVTNAGLRMSAEMFTETAGRARKILDDLNDLLDADNGGGLDQS